MRFRTMLSLAIILASPAAGQGTHLCGIPSGPAGASDFEVDVATGQEQGLTRYRIGNRVRLVFNNLNPFVFEYKIEYEETEIPEPGLELFQTAILPSSILTSAPTAAATTVPPPPPPSTKAVSSARRAPPDCSDVFAQHDGRVIALEQELSSKLAAAQSELAAIEVGLQSIDRAAMSHRAVLAGRTMVCQALANAVTDLQKILDVSAFEPILQALPGRQKGLVRKLGHQDGALEALEDTLESSGLCTAAEIASLFQPFRDRQTIYGKAVSELEPAIGRSKAKLDEIKTQLKGLGRLVADQLHKIGYLGPYDLPTKVTIKVFRREKAAAAFPSDAYLEYELRFGGRQRFVLATGASFSSLENREFEFSPGFELDETGMPTGEPTRVISLAEDSGSSVGILLALHTRVAECGSSGISWCHATFGASGRLENDFDVDVLIGWSVGFAEERFFVSLGFYNGRFRELRDGFSVGQALPAEQVEGVPVRENRKWRPGIALTYKFR